MIVSSKPRSPVVSRSRRSFSSSPVEPPAQGELEHLGHGLGGVALAQRAVDLRGVHAEREVGAHDRADARPRHVVDDVPRLLEHLERAHVGEALRAAGAQREPELRARQVPPEPGQLRGRDLACLADDAPHLEPRPGREVGGVALVLHQDQRAIDVLEQQRGRASLGPGGHEHRGLVRELVVEARHRGVEARPRVEQGDAPRGRRLGRGGQVRQHFDQRLGDDQRHRLSALLRRRPADVGGQPPAHDSRDVAKHDRMALGDALERGRVELEHIRGHPGDDRGGMGVASHQGGHPDRVPAAQLGGHPAAPSPAPRARGRSRSRASPPAGSPARHSSSPGSKLRGLISIATPVSSS